MLEYARTVRRLVTGKLLSDYLGDQQLRLATERAIEIIGEAARGISKPYRMAHPEVPWRAIMAQRHILAHEYGGIDHEKVWRVATEHVVSLIAVLEPLVPQPPLES